MKARTPGLFISTLLVGLLLLVGLAGSDQLAQAAGRADLQAQRPGPTLTGPYVSKPVIPADTKGLPPAPTAEKYIGEPRETKGRTSLPRSATTPSQSYDSVVQRTLGLKTMPATIQNFEGVSNMDGVLPPDTDGQVGPNHYVQMVNNSTAIYDKSGNLLYGPFHPNNLWPSGDPCNITNDGDVVVLYDQMADRWILTQFGLPTYPVGPYYECMAVSKGPTPTNLPGDWYPYTFLVHPDKMNDYPKMGVWPDGYYMTANQFPDNEGERYTSGAWVFERDRMLSGQAARFQYFDLADLSTSETYWEVLPGNLLGPTLPPKNTPNYLASVDQDWSGTDDVMHIFAFHTDWATPANSTFSLVKDLVVANFDGVLCNGDRNCIPQLGTSQGVDALAPRLMMHLWYRNFGDYDVLVANQTVDVDMDHAGIRWYEIRNPGDAAYIQQQGTFAPDSHHRWMGSIAMDRVGNMALGYSISSSTMYPSIRYTGRLAGDPLGQMPQGEGTIINGSGVQTSSAARWGDYSAMSVDPVDDCTFWYTQEYIQTTGSATWQTRIASFRFPECLANTGRLQGTVKSTGGDPIDHAQVTAETNPSYMIYSSADGSYGFPVLPPATYTVTAEAYGFQPGTVGGVNVTAGATTTQDLTLTPLSTYAVEGTVTDSATGWPLYASIDIAGYPFGPVWTDPVSGYYTVTLASSTLYTFTVSAWEGGYHAAVRAVGPLTMDVTETFTLTVDLGACTAPGYAPSAIAYSEDFEASNGGYTHSGTQDEWEWGTPTIWPNRCASGTRCWGTDLNGNYNDDASCTLTSPVIDLSGYSPGTLLTARWWQAWAIESAIYDTATAEVSINGGPWTEMWSHFGSTRQVDWTLMNYDISAAAGGNVRFRWRLTSDGGVNFEGYYVDDVEIAVGCDQLTGGLVVGNTYDENTSVALNGVTINTDGGASATSHATPDDPALDDGFYTAFSAAGSHVFTATLDDGPAGYDPDVATVNVILNDATRQDFYLPAGQLAYDPPALAITLDRGMTATLPFTLSNTGGAAASFQLVEVDGGAPADVPWLSEDPTSGVVAGLTDRVITVTFDAGVPGFTQAGEHHAQLEIQHDTLYVVANMPVTMTINPAYAVALSPETDTGWGMAGTTVDYTLHIVNTGNTTDTFDLQATGVWTATLSDPSVTLAADAGADVTVQVTIPGSAVANDSDDTVVTATSQHDAGATDSSTLTTVAAVYSVAMSPATDAGSGKPGTMVTYTLRITNTGNTTDTFGVSRAGNAWTTVLSGSSVTLAADAGADVTVRVTVPGNAAAGDDDGVTVTATSQHDAGATASSTLTTTADAVYGVEITPATDAGLGTPGATVDYVLRVINTGNSTDTFDLVATGVWTTTLSSPSVTLAAEAWADVTVQVIIPGSVAEGADDDTTVTATSQNDASATDSSTLTTTVILTRVYLPLVLRDH